jgi:glycosyltransferase involved in cell wall biosynthesis
MTKQTVDGRLFRKPCLLFVSLKYSPVHINHCRAYGEPLRKQGWKVKYLLSHEFAWKTPLSQLDHTIFLGSSRTLTGVLWDTLAILTANRQKIITLLRSLLPSLIFFESPHPANVIIASYARRVNPQIRLWALLHEPFVREKQYYNRRQRWVISVNHAITTLLLPLLDGVLVPSEEAMRQFKERYQHFKGLVLKVPLLFEDRSEVVNTKRQYFSFVGFATLSKGIDIFFKMVEFFAGHRREKKWEFQIVTSSDISGYLRKLSSSARDCLRVVNNWNLSDSEIDTAIRESYAVLAPYRYTTQSGVLPVAYMHGTPVISTAVGGLREFVIPGETGYTVENIDSWSEWERCFVLVQENFEQLTSKCRDFFLQHFDSNLASEYLKPVIESITV